jgi:death on curing protein
MKKVDYLFIEDLVEIATALIPNLKIRDLGLLESAAARPQTTVFGDDAYVTFPEKAGALMHSIARNHALIDGNKRLAWSATRVFCRINDFDLKMKIDDAEKLILDTSQGLIDIPEIAVIIKKSLIKL